MSLLPNATNVDPSLPYFVRYFELDRAISTLNSTIQNNISTTTSTLQGETASTIQTWSIYPAISSVNFANNEILSTTKIELDGVYITATYDEIFINGDPIVTSTAFAQMSSITQWAFYEALSTVNMNGNYIDNCPKIIMDGNVVTTAGDYILVNAANPVQTWAKFQASSNIDVNSKNINNANQLNFITATPGPLTTGATINALNSLNFSFVTAGLLQAGIKNINNIAFWNPTYPGVPGFYCNMYTKVLSYGGDAGSTYIATDTNLAVPRVFLGGGLGVAGSKLELIGDNAIWATVNDQPCPAAWSRFKATQAVDMNLQQAIGVAGVEFARTVDGPFNLLSINPAGLLTSENRLLVTSPAQADIDMNNFGLSNVRDIKFNAAGKLLTTNGAGRLTYDGQVITTGAEGSASNWAQYVANHNVVIPPAYNLSINPNNSVTFFPDCKFNANIYHGVAGSLVSPDFISFPTTFQVGTTVNPAREITMTAGAEGFGINSDTEINIDATVLINIFSDGPVSIESVTDFNLTASLTTFEIGVFNVAAAATTFEVASFDVVSAGNVSIEGTIATILFGATTITTAALGLTTAAAVIGCASWNLTSAGNVTTVGTQIGFTAGTKFETLSSGDTNLVANGIMNIQSLNAINLTAPIVNIANASISTLNTSSISVRQLNAYNVSTVNQYVESMFALYTGGSINVYDDLAGSKGIYAQTILAAPKVRASTIYGSSGATSNGLLFLEAPTVTATNNFKVTNTLFSEDARFLGITTISSIQSFVGEPVTFNNGITNIPNSATISTLTVQTINGQSYPPPSLFNQSDFISEDAVQTIATTPSPYYNLFLTFTAVTTGYTMVTGIVTIGSSNAANWNVYAQIGVNGTGVGQVVALTNTGNGHLLQVTCVYRMPTTAGVTYTLSVIVYGSPTVNGYINQGTLNYISGLV